MNTAYSVCICLRGIRCTLSYVKMNFVCFLQCILFSSPNAFRLDTAISFVYVPQMIQFLYALLGSFCRQSHHGMPMCSISRMETTIVYNCAQGNIEISWASK